MAATLHMNLKSIIKVLTHADASMVLVQIAWTLDALPCIHDCNYLHVHVHAYMYNKHTRQGTFVTVAMINIIDQYHYQYQYH